MTRDGAFNVAGLARSERTTMTFDVERVEAVCNRLELAKVIRELAEDLEKNPIAWTNADLPAFLDALAACVEDMDGYFSNRGDPVPVTPSWSTVAGMLAAARIYE
jgi:hypothetical protein